MLLPFAMTVAPVTDPELARELLTLGFLMRFAMAAMAFLLWRLTTGADGIRPHPLERLAGLVLLLEGLHGWIALIAAQSVGPVAAIRWFSHVPWQCAMVALLVGSMLRARRDAPDGRIPKAQFFIGTLFALQLAFVLFAV